MAAARGRGGLTAGQGANELTAIPLPESFRRASGPVTTAAAPPPQVGVDALLGRQSIPAPVAQPLGDYSVEPVFAPLPQPSEQTVMLRQGLAEAQGRLNDQAIQDEMTRSKLMEDYVSSVTAPLQPMEERPRLPDAPVMENWQAMVRDQMPLFALIAVLGAAGTRQPILNAMGAMTSATMALRNGQYEEYQRALKQWEVESKVALDKIEAWQAKRKEIMDSRTLTIEQKKAMLEAFDSNAKARQGPLQRRVDDLSGWLEMSQEDDKTLQKAKEARATALSAANATNARLGLSGEIAERRDLIAQQREVRQASRQAYTDAIANERLALEKVRIEMAKARAEGDKAKGETALRIAQLNLEAKQFAFDAAKSKASFAENDEKRKEAWHELRVKEKELDIEKKKMAQASMSSEDFSKADKMRANYEKRTKIWYDGLNAMDNIMNVGDAPIGKQLAQSWLQSLTPGGIRTNYQLQQIANTGDLGTRIENTISMWAKGVPGPQAEANLRELIRTLAPIYQAKIQEAAADATQDVRRVFAGASPETQITARQLIIPDRIPGPRFE